MKASTLFGFTLAVLLALGVVVGAKYLGWFEAPASATGPAPLKKAEKIEVLVAAHNLFQGVTALARDVKVRALAEAERDYYERNRDKLMPAVESAAEYRIVKDHLPAGTILLRDHFEKQAIPDNISERLDPGMRSVQMVLPRERAGGGVIQIGERVDVILTCTLVPNAPEASGAGCKTCNKAGGGCSSCAKQAPANSQTATATIARNLKVVAKRDSLWKVMASAPEDKPVSFTLQANPYRTALIEFTKLKGILTLVPAGVQVLGKGGNNAADADSKEFRDDEVRVAEFISGERTIGDGDLERIFNIRPPVPVIRNQAVAPVRVELFVGTRHTANSVFTPGMPATIERPAKAAAPAQHAPDDEGEEISARSFQFVQPNPASNATKNLAQPTIGRKQ